MITPALSLQECLERCQALRENAMHRSVDFKRANLSAFTQSAIEEAKFYDSLSQYLQRFSEGRREHSRNYTTTSWNPGADSFGEE